MIFFIFVKKKSWKTIIIYEKAGQWATLKLAFKDLK